MDPKDWKLIGLVEGGPVLQETPAGKKKKVPEDSPKASKKKTNKPTSDDLKMLNDNMFGFRGLIARLEVIILAKTFAVPVDTEEVVTSGKPFVDPAASTSKKTTGHSLVVTSIASPVQATWDVAASLTATQYVEAPGAKIRVATQLVEAPGVNVATQHAEVPSARPVVHSEPSSNSSEEVRPIDQSLTSKKTVTAAGVSAHSEIYSNDDQHSEQGSAAGVAEDQGDPSDRDIPRKKQLNQELPTTKGNRERGEVTKCRNLTLPHHLWMTTPIPVPGPSQLVQCLSSCQ